MASSTISRDGFSYSEGIFYAHVDKFKHERASTEKLRYLLNYVAEPEAPRRIDQPVHFYRAQLMHYGLRDFKTKPAAKKCLLTAIADTPDGSALLVPSSILKLEKKMRKEWEKLQEVDDMVDEDADEGTVDSFTDNGASDSAGDDGNISLDDEDDSVRLTDDEATSEYDSDAIPAFVIESRMGFFSLNKEVAEELLDDVLNECTNAEISLRYRLEKLGVLKKGGAYNFTRYPEGYTGKKIPPPSSRLDSAEDKQELDVDTKKRGNKRGRDSPSTHAQSVQKKQKLQFSDVTHFFSGKFKASAPEIAEEWPDYGVDGGYEMEFGLSTTAYLWGYFNFGVFEGYIRSIGPVSKPAGKEKKKIKFTWRGCERGGEGKMIYGPFKPYEGHITFYKNGKIKGALEGGMQTKFTGNRKDGPPGIRGYNPQHIREWKLEYRSINLTAQESGRDHMESPARSDTTDGRKSRYY